MITINANCNSRFFCKNGVFHRGLIFLYIFRNKPQLFLVKSGFLCAILSYRGSNRGGTGATKIEARSGVVYPLTKAI